MYKAIYSYDANQPLHSNLLQAYEESAIQDALNLGFGRSAMDIRGLSWMLYRITLELQSSTTLDAFEIRTWPSGHEKLFVYRDYEVIQGGEVKGGGSSTWLMVDQNTRKPVISRDIRKLLSGNEHAPHWERAVSSRKNGKLLYYSTHKVADVHIDYNNHLNNKLYVDFALGDLKKPYIFLKRLNVQYSREVQSGDTILCRTEQISQNELVHKLRSSSLGENVAIISSIWH